jgi:uncharacterized phiE125 gp8 family phage protein
MTSILLIAPAVEPLSLAEAKAFLRMETGDDDALITALIAGARLHIEGQTQLALITQSWRMVFDRWPKHGRIAVRPAPLKAVTAARVYDLHGNAQTVDTQAFVPDLGASMLAFVPWAVPVPTRIAAGIELDVTVGFGAAAADVPEPLRQAVRLLVAHWYENRGLIAAAGETALLPSTVTALIAPYRMLSL